MSLHMHQCLVHLQQVLRSIANISINVCKGLQLFTCLHSTCSRIVKSAWITALHCEHALIDAQQYTQHLQQIQVAAISKPPSHLRQPQLQASLHLRLLCPLPVAQP